MKEDQRLWSRSWLLRRNMNQSVLIILFDELGYIISEICILFSHISLKILHRFRIIPEYILNDLFFLLFRIQKQNTVMREAISSRDRFSATLCYLTTDNTFQDLAYSNNHVLLQIHFKLCMKLRRLIKVFKEKIMIFSSTSKDWKFIADNVHIVCTDALENKHIGPYSELIFSSEYESNSLNVPTPNRLPGFTYKMLYIIVGNNTFSLKQNLIKPYSNCRLIIAKKIFNYRFHMLLNLTPLLMKKVKANICVLLHYFFLSKCQWYVSSECRNFETSLDSSLLVRDNFTEYFNIAEVLNWQYDAIANENV
ncbi:hypothetical protein ACFW04_014624 [Cataglyphis niger]